MAQPAALVPGASQTSLAAAAARPSHTAPARVFFLLDDRSGWARQVRLASMHREGEKARRPASVFPCGSHSRPSGLGQSTTEK
jgi:hypothetical protein